MLIIGFDGKKVNSDSAIVKAIQQSCIGGVILFDYNLSSHKFDKNIQNPKQVARLTKSLQRYAAQATQCAKHQPLPLFISIDYEGGAVTRLKQRYGFPKTLSAREISQLTVTQAKGYAKKMAETLQRAGINLNFAPVSDVNVNPKNPIIGKLHRSFSADPDTVIKFASIFVQQYKAHNILCAFKHFPGHGSSTTDSHKGFVDVSHTWKTEELRPYQMLIPSSSNCHFIMAAHIVNTQLDPKGYPATLSKTMLTDILRKQLKFKGIIITDDMQMKAITDKYGLEEAVILAINAGANMLIFGNQLVAKAQDPNVIINLIYQNVQNHKISKMRINQAYKHIVNVKRRMRLPL